jgi:hypothetical protein
MDEQAYSNLLSELKDGTCAIILGPELCMLGKQNEEQISSMHDIIYEDLFKDKAHSVSDGFFYMNKITGKENRKTVLYAIENYYDQLLVPDYYYELAEIPFYLTISLSPDDLLPKALTSLKRPYEFVFMKKGTSGLYHRKPDANEEEMENVMIPDISFTPKPSNPLIFNFLGMYDDTDSLVFTYDSLFEFLYSVFPVENIPQNLRKAIEKATTLLFLGFGNNKWYSKIIFFILEKIQGDKKEFKAIFNHSQKHDEIVKFYTEQFDVKFFQESTIKFISKLHEDCDRLKILKANAKRPAIEGTKQEAKRYKIVYFSSNPDQLNPMNFDREYKQIEQTKLSKPKRDDFELVRHSATTQSELLFKINEEAPNLVIISAHGTKNQELLFENDQGNKVPLVAEQFLKQVKTLTESPFNRIECIIFSCCHSAMLAQSVSKIVGSAVGIEGPIQDEAMPVFMQGFFQTFFDTSDVSYSAKIGKALLENRENLKSNAPLIKVYQQ